MQEHSDSTAQTYRQPAHHVQYAQKAEPSNTDPETPKSYRFSVEDEDYFIDENGTGSLTIGGRQSAIFELPVEGMPYIEELYFIPYGDHVLVLLYELSDGEGGMSKVARVYRPELQTTFTADIPGFNLGPAALEGNHLYVSAGGFLGCLNLDRWQYEWTHGNLYERYSANAFGKPEVFVNTVVFPAQISERKGSVRMVVEKSSAALTVDADSM
jgi:hypothetical protein